VEEVEVKAYKGYETMSKKHSQVEYHKDKQGRTRPIFSPNTKSHLLQAHQ
jgi:hypothetical protein